MTKLSPEDEQRKKLIFDGMSEKRQKFILKHGYDKWDPFIPPQDPIDMRNDKTKRTTQVLVSKFLQTCNANNYSNAYAQGALDICLGVINDDERYKGMFDFACWYQQILEKEKTNNL